MYIREYNSRSGFTGIGFKIAGVSLPNLEKLNLSFCKQITDRGLIKILSISGNTLRELNLVGTEITGIGFKEAGLSLRNLEKPNLVHCKKTHGDIEYIRK